MSRAHLIFRFVAFVAIGSLHITSSSVSQDSFSDFGVPRSDMLDTPMIYPLSSGTLPRLGQGVAARRTIWDRSYAWPQSAQPAVPRLRRVRRLFHH
jgi:hypothetical protein